jgi:uroporphyrinogen-III decarboxylase
MTGQTMTHRERFFALLEGRPVDRLPFFPDISDWYKARRTPAGEPQVYQTGALIPDGIGFHNAPSSGRAPSAAREMPPEWASWSYLDFYRNYDWGLPVHIYDWLQVHSDGYTIEVEESDTSRLEGWHPVYGFMTYLHPSRVHVDERLPIRKRVTHRWVTPVGTLSSVKEMALDGSMAQVKYPVETLEDLDVLETIVAHTEFRVDWARIDHILGQIGDMGVADLAVWRSPFGRIVQEYVGLQQTVYWLYDHRQRMLDLLRVLEEQDLRVIELAARSNARIVIISDHADDALLGPRWYKEFCMPYYRKANQILHEHGKVVSTHLDGNILRLLPLLAETGFDLLDGCTPAPMTNYRPDELAAALGEGQYAYCGVPSVLFTQGVGDEVILDSAQEIYEALRGRLVLNVGDVLPPNGDMRQVIRLGEWSKEREP